MLHASCNQQCPFEKVMTAQDWGCCMQQAGSCCLGVHFAALQSRKAAQ